MKPVVIETPDESRERSKELLAMYMSRGHGVDATKRKITKLREGGYVIVEIWKVMYKDSIYMIFYNKGKELQDKDDARTDLSLSLQPNVASVPKFSSNGL